MTVRYIPPSDAEMLAKLLIRLPGCDAELGRKVADEFYSEPRIFEVDVRDDKDSAHHAIKWCADRIRAAQKDA